MKLIIQNNQAIAAVTDSYLPSGTEQDIVSVPDDFDVLSLSEYTYLGNDVATAKHNLICSLEAQRLVCQNGGLSYTFTPAVQAVQGVTAVAAVPAVYATDGTTIITPAIPAVVGVSAVEGVPAVIGTIQTRDQTQYPDIANINGSVTAALVLASQNVTSPVLTFRDQQNVNHTMTPAQMVAMGMAVSAFISNTYAHKWTLSGEISLLDTLEQAQQFDITSNWPTS